MLFYSTEQALQDCFMLTSGSVNFFVDETEENCRPLEISSRQIGCEPDPYKSDLLHHARIPNKKDYDKISQLAVIKEIGIGPMFEKHFLSILQNGSSVWAPYAIQALPDLVIIYYQYTAGGTIAAIVISDFQQGLEVDVPVSDNLDDNATVKFCFYSLVEVDLGPCMYIHHGDQQVYRLRFQDPKHPDYQHCLIKLRHAIPLN